MRRERCKSRPIAVGCRNETLSTSGMGWVSSFTYWHWGCRISSRHLVRIASECDDERTFLRIKLGDPSGVNRGVILVHSCRTFTQSSLP